MSENVGASTSCNPMGLHGLYRDSFTFYLLQIITQCNRMLKYSIMIYSTEVPAYLLGFRTSIMKKNLWLLGTINFPVNFLDMKYIKDKLRH
jgi:hypothetical protein